MASRERDKFGRERAGPENCCAGAGSDHFPVSCHAELESRGSNTSVPRWCTIPLNAAMPSLVLTGDMSVDTSAECGYTLRHET